MRTDPGSLPDQCGVYLFKARSGKVLDVGKAIDIRARVRSHLQDKKNDKEIKLRIAPLGIHTKVLVPSKKSSFRGI